MINSRIFSRWIGISLALGIFCGIALQSLDSYPFVNEYIVDGMLKVVSDIFLSSLKMLVVPLVFISLVCGVAGLDDIRVLGRVGITTLFLYLFTTALAVILGLTLASWIAPGDGFDLPSQVQFESSEAPSLSAVVTALIPSNIFRAAADGNVLQIIFVALLFGVSLALAKGSVHHILEFFNGLNNVIMNMVGLLMWVAPFGVFALLARVFARHGAEAILPLIKYFLVVTLCLFLHVFVTLNLLMILAARKSPREFFSQMRPALVYAFSTASSNATIPITMRQVTEEMAIPKEIASFTIPLGATINMDGTAIMQGVATVFIAQAYQIPLTIIDLLTVVLTATLASIGTAGVPGVGLIMLAMVLRQVNLPVEGIGLILGVDRFLDMMRSAVNVCGDAVVTVIVAYRESQRQVN